MLSIGRKPIVVKIEPVDMETDTHVETKTKPKPKVSTQKHKRRKKKTIKKESGDISSGEEEEETVNKTKTRTKKNKPVRPPPELESESAPVLKVEIPYLPVIRDLEQMPMDHPYMTTDPTAIFPCVGMSEAQNMDTSPEALAAAAIAAIPGLKSKRERERKKQEAKDLADAQMSSPKEMPLTSSHAIIQKKINDMATIRTIALDRKDWNEQDQLTALQQELLFLPKMIAALDQALLRACGRWTYTNNKEYDFPPCPNGIKCVGITAKVVNEDGVTFFEHVLTSMMFREEFDHFIETGEAPTRRLSCVGCCRSELRDVILALRGERVMRKNQDGKDEQKNQQELHLKANQLIQRYRNKRECEGGYFRDCMIEPLENVWEGMIGPVAEFRASYMVGRVTKQGHPYIDQTAIVWEPKEAETPMIGETVQDFSTGVGN